MWFQHDGTPAHFSEDVRSALHTAYPWRWIGRGGPVNWPARSPDLFSLDIFLWDHIKSLVYASPVDSKEALVESIAVVAGKIRKKIIRVRKKIIRVPFSTSQHSYALRTYIKLFIFILSREVAHVYYASVSQTVGREHIENIKGLKIIFWNEVKQNAF
ncbi:uncharacterized protein TNCV_1337491 [Trichonephila clavipes]|nr:uncharacterized protein TNCV_1337491 [Trichonephila clavipes]